MYLTKEIYIGAEFQHRKITGKIEIFEDGKPIRIDFGKVSSIEERVGYWRKANAIHNWFVLNVQDGVDDCQKAYVSFKKTQELLNTCEKVLADPSLAMELLPPAAGFFFGPTGIDEYYMQDLQDTVMILMGVEEDDDIYYQSSW
jgi:hypothetical protein